MLEGVLASLIDRIAGKYVDGIDKKATNMSVWSGHIVLKDLALKPTCLDDMDLPIKMRYGRLEQLSLDIPWKNLRAKPVIVHLSGLYMIVGPNTDASRSAQESKRLELEAKLAAVSDLDAIDPEDGLGGEEPQGSYTARLVNKILSNIQLKVSDIHVRYEDTYTDPERPLALGIMLKSFTAESTNERWQPSFVEHQRILYKLVDLDGLCVYLNSDCRWDGASLSLLGPMYQEMLSDMVFDMATESLSNMDLADAGASSQPSSSSTSAPRLHEPQYLIKPIGGTLKLLLLQSGRQDEATPRYDATVEMTRVAIRVQKRQYRDMLRILDFLGNHERIVRYAQFRPPVPVSANPKAWWHFAYSCVVWEREQRLRRFDKKLVIRTLRLWPRYASYYRRRYAELFELQPLGSEDVMTMRVLEEELPLEAIKAVRDNVNREVREALRKQAGQRKAKEQSPKRVGILGRVYGWMSSSPSKQAQSGGGGGGGGGGDSERKEKMSATAAKNRLLVEMGITDEDGAERAGDDDSEDGASEDEEDVSPDRLMGIRILFLLHRGSITLVTNGDRGEEVPISMVNYRNISLEFVTRPSSMDITLKLASFVVTDLYSQSLAPGFHRIISRFEAPEAQAVSSAASWSAPGAFSAGVSGGWGLVKAVANSATSAMSPSPSSTRGGAGKGDAGEVKPLLWLKYESKPLDNNADSRLSIRLDRLTVVYSTAWLRALSGFIDVGESSPALESLKKAAAEQLEEARKASEHNIKAALREKLVFDMCIDVRSPLILIPHNTDRSASNTDVVVLQPGNLTVWTMRKNLIHTSPLLQSMAALPTSDERLYNSLLLELSDVSVLVCDRRTCWNTAPGAGPQSLINDIRISICVDNSIVQQGESSASTIVNVALPYLNMSFSKHKYQAIIKVLSAVFSSPVESAGAPRDASRREGGAAHSNGEEMSGTGSRAGMNGGTGTGWEGSSSRSLMSRLDNANAVSSGEEGGGAQERRGDVSEAEDGHVTRTIDVRLSVAPSDAVSLTLNDEKGVGTPMHASGDRIAVLTLRGMEGSYVGYSDGSSSAELSITSVQVEDVRARESNSFRRLVSPSSDGNKLLSVQMLTAADSSVEYVASIGHIDFTCVPSALLPILKVFESPPTSAATSSTTRRVVEEVQQRARAASHSQLPASPLFAPLHESSAYYSMGSTASSASATSNHNNKAISSSRPPVVAHLFLLSPSITLVEDCANVESRRLSLRLSMMMKHETMWDGSSSGKAHVQDLQINVQGKGWDVKTPIVEPLSVSCSYMLEMDGSSHVSVVATNTEVWVSYTDMKLLAAIADTMKDFSPPAEGLAGDESSQGLSRLEEAGGRRGGAGAETGGVSGEAKPGLVVCEGADGAASRLESSAASAGGGAAACRQDWTVECETMKVTLINDCGGFNEPFCTLQFEHLRCGISRSCEGETTQAMRCHMAAALFNSTVIEFEPIMEDWTFSIEATSREHPAQSGLRLSSPEVLNLNMTEGQISNLLSTLEMWQGEWFGSREAGSGGGGGGGGGGRRKNGGGVYSSYAIRNRCNEQVCIRSLWRDGVQGSPPLVLDPGACVPFFFHDRLFKRHTAQMVQRMHRAKADRSRKLHVSVGSVDEEEAFAVQVDIKGVRVLHTKAGARIIAEVAEGETAGSHVLTLSSGVSLCNECDVAVDVRVLNEAQDILMSLSLQPRGEVMDLPLILANADDLFLAVRPAASASSPSLPRSSSNLSRQGSGSSSGSNAAEKFDYNWSLPFGLASELDSVVECDAPDARRWHVRAVSRVASRMSIDGEPADTLSMAIMPVLIISNMLPCPLAFCFLLEGDAAPLSHRIEAASGSNVHIHHIDLSRKVSMGVALEGLDAGSEFVPIFCPDGSAPETNLTLYDSNRDFIRLSLSHKQESLEPFSVSVSSAYWFDNRTGFPLIVGQKWTASNVTMRGGQLDDGGGLPLKQGMPDPSHLHEILTGGGRPPMPYSFHSKVDLGGAKACVRLGKPFEKFCTREGTMGACDWSNPFTIDTVGATQSVEIVGEGFCFEAVMLVSPGPGRFSSTKVVTLLPRYIVVNKLDQPVQIGQVGCEESCPTVIGTGELQVVRWLDESKDRSLRIKLLPDAASGHEDWEWQWSDPMSRNTVGYFALKLRAKKLRPDGSPRVFNLALQVSLQGACTVIVIRQQDPSCPAIQIHNTSSWASVAYRQAGIDSDLEERSLPGVPTGYCWDRQQGPNVLSLRVTPRDQGVGVGELDCNMDRLGTFPILKVGDRRLRIKVEARGPTKVLSIEDQIEGDVDEESVVSAVTAASDDVSASSSGAITGPGWFLSVSLMGVGLSVIDATPSELIYVSLTSLHLEVVTSGDWQLTDAHVHRIQIDNQTSLGQPVLLGLASGSLTPLHDPLLATNRPSSASANRQQMVDGAASPSRGNVSGGASEAEQGSGAVGEGGRGADNGGAAGDDWFMCVKVARSLKNSSLDSFHKFDVAIRDLALDIDERLLVKLLSATQGILKAALSPANEQVTSEDIKRVGALDLSSLTSDRDASSVRWTYVERLRISPIRLFVTFSGSDDAHGLLNNLTISKLPFFAFVEAAKAMVSNIDRAPIYLSLIDWQQPFLPRDELIGRVSKHYRNSILGGFYRLVGSLEFLGNPTGLVSNISSGMQEFVEYSREGIKEGKLGKGLAMGTGRLAAGTVQGVFGSAAGLSGAMGKGLAQLTFDGDYKRARALLDQNKPMHLGQGVWQGGRAVGRGFYQGVTGVVTQPIKGYSRAGTRGAIKGIGKGLVGAVVKPMAGMIDMVSQTSEGIRNTPEYMSRKGASITRVRLPRHWEKGTAVRGYDRRHAMGCALLARVASIMEWRSEDVGVLVDYLCWTNPVQGSLVIFLTTRRLLVCQRHGAMSEARRGGGGEGGPGLLKITNNIPIEDIVSITEVEAEIKVRRREEAGEYGVEETGCLGLCKRPRGESELCSLHIVEHTMRQWLLQRLRSVTHSIESSLPGEDWSLVAHEGDERQGSDERGGPNSSSNNNARRNSSSNNRNRALMEGALQNSGETLRLVSLQVGEAERRGQHAVYIIKCTLQLPSGAQQQWVVSRRYREFDRLRRDIVGRTRAPPTDSNENKEDAVAALPKKRVFGNVSPAVMRERVEGFNNWIQGLQAMSVGHEARSRLIGKFINAPAIVGVSREHASRTGR